MAEKCAPCGKKMIGKQSLIPPGRRKQWRVFFGTGQARDYYTEDDADSAISKYCGDDPSRCRKQKLSRT